MTLQNTASPAAGNRPTPNTLHQNHPTFTSIDVNENRGDCDVGAHLGLFFSLIDVDRTASDRPFPTLCFGVQELVMFPPSSKEPQE